MFYGSLVRRGLIAATAGAVIAGPLLGAATAWADTGTGSIAGLVWFDRNSDHRQDNGEPAFGASTVTVTDVADGTSTTITTDMIKGTYALDGLKPGVYEVSGAQAGYASTTAPAVCVTVPAGGRATADFGIRGGTIVGKAWVDSNGDGLRQPGEPPLAGVNFTAYEPNLRHNNAAASDASGNYAIQDLPAGSYQLSAGTPDPTYGLTRSGGDSAFDPLTQSVGSPVRVDTGRRINPIDAGFVEAHLDTAITALTVPDQLHVGDQVSIAVDAANLSDAAEILNGSVAFPTGITPVSATATGGLPAAVSGQYASFGSFNSFVAPHTTVHVTIVVKVTGALSNATITANATKFAGDINPANNTFTQQVSTIG
ncbi:SdrD B-like domain-containing protein [Kutzneria buriramensis]|uniref:SdrD B-like protein n=1 Tax=Kutzneria buriramensis TaxID=1045776 RepID=A0A3E0HAQ4_9PSEU|nr:SdrD B-like domain-containing protein [Kutzneria buriramensis]REH40968.1 SdrD B-like protein [Kutzneria buriramensis]